MSIALPPSKRELPPFCFDQQTRSKIINDYVGFIFDACRATGVAPAYISYSEQELSFAVAEAELDVRYLLGRRSPKDGISQGKIAGVVAFRLARFKILHFAEEAFSHAQAPFVQELAALLLVNRLFIKNKDVPARGLYELAYQLSRRHANQETLGVFFDVFTHQQENPQEQAA